LRGEFEPLCPVCGGVIANAPTPEDSPTTPNSFYGLTKLTQEQIGLMFSDVLGIPTAALRYQNVFGAGQSLKNPYTGILAVFTNLARENKPINVFEDGLESRDFVHVSDVVEATTAALIKPLSGSHSINVGTGLSTSVNQVAALICEFLDSRSEISVTGAFRDGDIRHGRADISRARTLLAYSPKTSFRAGLESFLNWALNFETASGGYERSIEELQRAGLYHGG
jgi:dTDP-L-rhamnose 4-epimerase